MGMVDMLLLDMDNGSSPVGIEMMVLGDICFVIVGASY
jgi:hypothetical protein